MPGGGAGQKPNPPTEGGGGGIGTRPPFGGGTRPTRPSGGGLVGRPGTNRPEGDDNLGSLGRPGIGNRPNLTKIGNRGQIAGNHTNIRNPIGNNSGNRTQIGSNNIVNRPTNISTHMINNSVNQNFTNVNGWGRYGAGAWGPGYGGFYRVNPYSAYRAGWVNGYWSGHYPGWGWGFGNSVLGWGVGIGIAAWGIGSLFNSWGYSSFANPHYIPMIAPASNTTVVVQQPIVYDYSQPLDLASQPQQAQIEQSNSAIDLARNAFRSGDFTGALASVEVALKQTPNDPNLHEFRALCLFALGRYEEAAVPMYTVLSAGPGWDWTTVAGLYSNVDAYTRQLRELEAYCKAHDNAASARFLLASLYLTQGSNEAALNMLKKVVALKPNDTLSAQLISGLAPPASATTTAEAPPPPAADQPSQNANEPGPALPEGPIPAKLTGAWTANPAQGVTITLELKGEKDFSWKVHDRGQTRLFQGQAGYDASTLALKPPDQPPMVGTITWSDHNHFQFKALGAPVGDPGLAFAR